MLLKDKVALITGANRGIGKAIAQTFAAHGARLVLCARTEGSLDDLKNELETAHNSTIDCFYFNVDNPEEVKTVFQSVFKLTKKLDVLVNNAGRLGDSLIPMMTPDLIESVYKTNTFGLLYCLQYASRLMARQKSGSIINLTSIMGVEGEVGQVIYSGSKSAVIGITKSAAKELAAQGIRVNAISPGLIQTDMVSGLPEDKLSERIDSVKMGRIGTPEEVADTALFLASSMSSYVTGQVIGVDGCMTL